MEKPTKQLKEKIFKRDYYRCGYCLKKFLVELLTIDHIHPISKGGDSNPENLLTACLTCNQRKHAKILKNPPIPKSIPIEEGDYSEDKIRYPVQTLRTSKENWQEFNQNRQNLELSWSQYIKYINKLLNTKNGK